MARSSGVSHRAFARISSPLSMLGAGLLGASILLSACGGEVPLDYTVETRDNFLAACTDRIVDSPLATELCECTFAEAQKLPFARFAEIEERLKGDLNASLGVVMNKALADCVLKEADL